MPDHDLVQIRKSESKVEKSVSGGPKFKEYLEYPGVANLLKKAKAKKEKGEKVVFHSFVTSLHNNWDTKFKYLLDSPIVNRISLVYSGNFARILSEKGMHSELLRYASETKLGVPTTHFYSLLTKQLGSIKALDAFSFAQIEATANFKYRKKFFQGNKLIDIFWNPDGVVNLELFGEVLKAHNFSHGDIPVLAIPKNAFKAFRVGKLADWEEIESMQTQLENSKILQFDKNGNEISEINLIHNDYLNLASPLYKVRAGEFWVIVVPISDDLSHELNGEKDFCKKITDRLTVDKDEPSIYLDYRNANDFLREGVESVEDLEKLMNYDLPSHGVISCSLGQSTRVVFELVGGFDNIPEALLYPDGGSCSSVVTEKNSDGRHVGVHNMHDVLKHEWHKREDVAIPWNYLSFDRVTEANEYLFEDDNAFFLSFDEDQTKSLSQKVVFLELPQNWKQVSNELLVFMIKETYREFLSLAMRKYHINIKDLFDMVTRYLGVAVLYSEDSKEYHHELTKLDVPDEVHEFLKLISYVHFAACGEFDYYSGKTHPLSILRLQWLAKAHSGLKKHMGNAIQKFETELKRILSRDINSEFTTIENLYFSEFNKL